LTVQKIYECRNCKQKNLTLVLDLGEQPLSGVFPKLEEGDPLSGPLELMKCDDCRLVQLGHNFPLDLMYGENYGYSSSLNSSMAQHLSRKAKILLNKYFPSDKNLSILDIGANDGTLLKSIEKQDHVLYAVDPTITKFEDSYLERPDIIAISDFFDGRKLNEENPKGFDVITTISMFYDLLEPTKFVEDISLNLKEEGIWHSEQSYLYSMLDSNAFDTICHEHLEYYTLESVESILTETDLRVIDVALNKTNGGSFAFTVAKRSSKKTVSETVIWLRDYEKEKNLDQELSDFIARVELVRVGLINLISEIKKAKKKLAAIGASTKGNVLLNYFGLSNFDLRCISDVNVYKHGRVTPGTRIPIVSELEFKELEPDYAIVLPWHFQDSIILRETEFLNRGGRLIFPLPSIQVIED
jgi:hypothetical protein